MEDKELTVILNTAGAIPEATLGTLTVEDGVVILPEATTPSAVADSGKIYTKADNELYFQSGDGTETVISKEHACLYITSATETSIATVNTPVKALGTTAEVTSSDHFTVSTSNRITYTGANTRIVKFDVTVSMTSATNLKVFSLYIAKNGTILTASQQQRKIATSGDVGNISLSCMPSLTPMLP